MKDKDFFIDKDGFKLHAKMDYPDNQQDKNPLVILAHGLTGHMEEPHIVGIAEAMRQSGYIVLRIELYGHGKSDGDFKNHNLLEWVSELMYVIEYAAHLDSVSEIILAGHSQGGLATILTAGIMADRLKAIICLSPALCIRAHCRSGMFFDTPFDSRTIPDQFEFWEGNVLSGNYVRIGRNLPIEDAIEAYTGPVLIVHGTADGAVPYSDSVKLAQQYKDAKLVPIPEDGHCYENDLEMVEDAVSSFLKELG